MEEIDLILKRFENLQKEVASTQAQQIALKSSMERLVSKHGEVAEQSLLKVNKVLSSIPSSIEQKKIYGINLSTKFWLGIVVLAIIATVFLVPEANYKRIEYLNTQIEDLKFEVEYFRSRNPKTASQFDQEYR